MFQKDAVWSNISTTRAYPMTSHESKVIIEKSRGEGSLMEQDTIENVSQPIFLRKKYFFFLTSFYAKKSLSLVFFD